MELSKVTHILIIFATLFILIYLYYKRKFRFWKHLGLPYIEAIFPFGNLKNHFLKRIPFFEITQTFYIETKKNGGRYIGMYFFSRPQLLIIDPVLIKHILATDFQHFHGRGVFYNEDNDPLSASLIALDGEKWKNIRTKLTPTFSSGKLKNMFQIILTQGQELVKLIENEKAVEIKELIARYGTDVIGSCAFGLDCNSLKNPNSKFRKAGKRFMNENIFDIGRRIFQRSFPSLAKKLNMRVLPTEASTFFMNTFLDNVKYRKANKFERKDFFQLLMELIDLENYGKEGLTLNEAAAQAFIFFLAGFETSATTMAFAMYELATNIGIQEKLRNEINETLKKHNQEITYNCIMDMNYMDKVILETLRKWPTVPFLLRKCNQAYKIPDSNHTVPKGVYIFIPTFAIHRDPDIYPDPLKFNPDRFINDDTFKTINNSYTFLPFGNGPRICIGVRFALIQIKVALTLLLSKYQFTLNDKTKLPFEFAFNPTSLNIKNDIWLNVNSIKDSVD